MVPRVQQVLPLVLAARQGRISEKQAGAPGAFMHSNHPSSALVNCDCVVSCSHRNGWQRDGLYHEPTNTLFILHHIQNTGGHSRHMMQADPHPPLPRGHLVKPSMRRSKT